MIRRTLSLTRYSWFDYFPRIVVEAGMHPFNKISSLMQRNQITELADLVSSEFQNDGNGNIKNPKGKIVGYDGDYLSIDSLDSELGETEIKLGSSPVKVSEDLASSHYYLEIWGHQELNQVMCLGSHIVPIVKDGSGKYVLPITRRPADAFLYPNAIDTAGASVPIKRKDDYVAAVVEKINSKWKAKLDYQKVKPFGVVFDNVSNYFLPSGLIIAGETDIEGSSIEYVPVAEFEKYVEKNGLREWSPTVFTAVCMAIEVLGRDEGNSDYVNMSKRVFSAEKESFRNKPWEVNSVLRNLGIV